MEPNIPTENSSDTAFTAANPRRRNRASGSMGLPPRRATRRSQPMKAPTPAAPASSDVRTAGLVHPWLSPRTSPSVTPSRPAEMIATPGRSSRPASPRDSVSLRSASGSVTRPIGTFSQKIHCQLAPSVIAPPTSGPTATASPDIAPHTPSAAPRRSGGTAADSNVRLSGRTSAAPTPCMARAAMSASMDGASAAPRLPRVNSPSPVANTARRPSRSPSAAPVSSSTANGSV